MEIHDDKYADVTVKFEAIPIDKLDEFEKMVKAIGELVGTEVIDFGIYESY